MCIRDSLLLKSAFDMLAAFILMVALAPLFVVLSALVWFEDHGPVFYTCLLYTSRCV